MHIFKFSVRRGTRAEQMTPQIPEQTKAERSNALLQLDKQMQTKYHKTFYSEKEPVLFEEYTKINGNEYVIGHNERYVKIAVPKEKISDTWLNEIIPVIIEKNLTDDILLGKMG